MLISPEYKSILREKHKERKWGSGGKYVQIIQTFAREKHCRNVLDYGCGKAALENKLFLEYTGYDPGIKGKDIPPTDPFDIVLCIDVLEHIEKQYLDNVLKHIHSLSKKAAFFLIATKRAGHDLPPPRNKQDEEFYKAHGQNAHLIVKDNVWWLDKLDPLFECHRIHMEPFNFWTTATPR